MFTVPDTSVASLSSDLQFFSLNLFTSEINNNNYLFECLSIFRCKL